MVRFDPCKPIWTMPSAPLPRTTTVCSTFRHCMRCVPRDVKSSAVWRVADGSACTKACTGSPVPRSRGRARCLPRAGQVAFTAVASHRLAAALWELPGGRTDVVEITCPRWRRNQEDGPVVHESKALDPADGRVVDNIPVTSPELTLLMLGAVCSPLTVEMALDRALLRGLVTQRSVREVLERRGRRGRNGVGALREAMRTRVPGQAVPESPMETQLLWLLRQLGFPPPVPQYEVRHHGEFIGRLDAAYPEQCVGLEYQSYEHHLGKSALDGDNARRRKFKNIGWDVLEVTPKDLHNRGLHLAPELQKALGSFWRQSGPPIRWLSDAKTERGGATCVCRWRRRRWCGRSGTAASRAGRRRGTSRWGDRAAQFRW